MTSYNVPTRENAFVPGDRVVDFRGEQRGVVRKTECDRGPGKSDMINVEFIGGRHDGAWNHFYEGAWRHD